MKVLQINSFFTVGGPPRIVNGIYDTLKEEGHECKIAAAREKLYKPEDSIRIGNQLGVYMNALSCRLSDNDGFRSKAATRRLVEEIKAYDPDVIHLHNLHGYYINIEILFDYLKTCGKKIFWTLHDCWAFTGHCPHFVTVGCDQWKTRCITCTQMKEYPACSLKGNVTENFDRKKNAFTGVPNMTIVTPSKWLGDLVKQSFLGEYPVVVKYNKIDTHVFKPTQGNFREKYNLGNKKIILGVAQNWSKSKGLDDFIELTKRLDDNYKVVIVGLTQKQIEEVERQASAICLSRTNNVPELAEIYTAADVFVNCTYADTFPTVNLEALSCGTPVVTYRTGGSPEALSEGCGTVVEQGNLQLLIEAVRHTVKNPEICVERASFFDRKANRLEFIELYEEQK